MFYIFIGLIVLYVVFCKVSNKYRSKYTSKHIFGKKGSGKTTLMVAMMVKDMRSGWNVYTDIPDIAINGVRHIEITDLIDKVPPPHSAVYLDEVGITADGRKFKTFPDGLRDFVCLHRHYKIKLVTASQTWDVDKKIRDRADSLVLVSNLGMFSLIRPIKRTFTLTAASEMGESRIADSLKFYGPLSWRFVFIPRWVKGFNSFNTPYREVYVSEAIENQHSIKEFKLFHRKKKRG